LAIEVLFPEANPIDDFREHQLIINLWSFNNLPEENQNLTILPKN